jgi:hypothetical protein
LHCTNLTSSSGPLYPRSQRDPVELVGRQNAIRLRLLRWRHGSVGSSGRSDPVERQQAIVQCHVGRKTKPD